MADGRTTSTVRGLTGLRYVCMALTGAWASFWLLLGSAALVLSADGTTSLTWMVLMFTALVPALPFWIGPIVRYRRRHRAAAAPQPPPPTPARAVAPPSEPAELSLATRNEWERLERARALVQEFAEAGWIDPAALTEVDGHMGKLRRLLTADEQTSRLGGDVSPTLHAQLGGLVALLVALADAAVEHQAALISEDPVPVTLAEARDRLSASSQAYRDLQQPG